MSSKCHLTLGQIAAAALSVPALISGLTYAFCQPFSDVLSACRRTSLPQEKISFCSQVIVLTRDRAVLERMYNRRGLAFAQLGEHRKAADDFTQAIALNPKLAGYYDNRQSAFKALGLFNEALSDANATIRLSPNLSFGYRSRALLFEAAGRHDQALADLSAAVEFEPRDAGLKFDRGKIQAEVGRFFEAIDSFNQALLINPEGIDAYRERGLTYEKVGSATSALRDLLVFARTNPNDSEVNAAIGRLQVPFKLPKEGLPNIAGLQPSSKPREPDHGDGSQGTGFFISSDGFAVTNAHVVAGCSAVRISSGLSSQTAADVIARDTSNDLALLKTNVTPKRIANLRASVKVGEGVSTFGYPLNGLLASAGNYTTGNVSALAGLNDDTRFLQISAPVQPGNSGGPLVDKAGRVVGIVTSKLNVLKLASLNQDMAQNVNFAIKASAVISFLDAYGAPFQSAKSDTEPQPADPVEEARSMTMMVGCIH